VITDNKVISKKFYSLNNFDEIPQIQGLSSQDKFAMQVVAHVFPFRTNSYILENLIDWKKGVEDPMFRLNFMDREMLAESEFVSLADALRNKASSEEIKTITNQIRLNLNPHPAGQLTANVPQLEDQPVQGIQHKYRETVLIFPSPGQTCFAYCTYCFRWPQFVDINGYKFSTNGDNHFLDYIRQHKEITDVIITGGDPMIMSAANLSKYVEPFLEPEFEHIQNIRIGTKVLGHWPYRFLTDEDSDDLLRLFERVVENGKHLAFMSHFSHPIELSTEAVKQASLRIRSTGAVIRTQAPLIRNINDSGNLWADLWKEQVKLGMIPYYMFVERDTGPRNYFEIPLFRALDIYSEAIQQVSGLARTVRGPSMSAYPGKVCIEGITEINQEKLFVLSFLQARSPEWVKTPFFAQYNEDAVWLDDLKPALGHPKFFFETP